MAAAVGRFRTTPTFEQALQAVSDNAMEIDFSQEINLAFIANSAAALDRDDARAARWVTEAITDIRGLQSAAGGGASSVAHSPHPVIQQPAPVSTEAHHLPQAAPSAAQQAASNGGRQRTVPELRQELPKAVSDAIRFNTVSQRNRQHVSNETHAFIRRLTEWRYENADWLAATKKERRDMVPPGPKPLAPNSSAYEKVRLEWETTHAIWEKTREHKRGPEPVWPAELGPPPREQREVAETKLKREQRDKARALAKQEEGPKQFITSEQVRAAKSSKGKAPEPPVPKPVAKTSTGRLRYDDDGTPHVLARIYTAPGRSEMRLAVKELRSAQSSRDKRLFKYPGKYVNGIFERDLRDTNLPTTRESIERMVRGEDQVDLGEGGVTQQWIDLRIAARQRRITKKDVEDLDLVAAIDLMSGAHSMALPVDAATVVTVVIFAVLEEVLKCITGHIQFGILEAAVKILACGACLDAPSLARGALISIIGHTLLGCMSLPLAVLIHSLHNLGTRCAYGLTAAPDQLMIFSFLFNVYDYVTTILQLSTPPVPSVVMLVTSAFEEEFCKMFLTHGIVLAEVLVKMLCGQNGNDLGIAVAAHYAFSIPYTIWGISLETYLAAVALHVSWNLSVHVSKYMSFGFYLGGEQITLALAYGDAALGVIDEQLDLSALLRGQAPGPDHPNTIQRICGPDRTMCYSNRDGLLYKNENPLKTFLLGGVWRRLVVGEPFFPASVNISAADRKHVTDKSRYIVHPVYEVEVRFPGLQWRFWRALTFYKQEFSGNVNLQALLHWPTVHMERSHTQRVSSFLQTGGNNPFIGDCLDAERTMTARFHACLSAYLTGSETLNRPSPDATFMDFLLMPFCRNQAPTSSRTSGPAETRATAKAAHWESFGLKLQDGKVLADQSDSPQPTETSATSLQGSSSESATPRSSREPAAGSGAAATSPGTQEPSSLLNSGGANQPPHSSSGSRNGQSRKQRKTRSGETSNQQPSAAGSAAQTSPQNPSSSPNSTGAQNTPASSTHTGRSQSLSSALCSLTSTRRSSNTGALSKAWHQLIAHSIFILCCMGDASVRLTFQAWSAITVVISLNFSMTLASLCLSLGLCLLACASCCVIITVANAAWCLTSLKQLCQRPSCLGPQTHHPETESSTSSSSPTSSSPPSTQTSDTTPSAESSVSSEGVSRVMTASARPNATSLRTRLLTLGSASSSPTTNRTARPHSAGSPNHHRPAP